MLSSFLSFIYPSFLVSDFALLQLPLLARLLIALCGIAFLLSSFYDFFSPIGKYHTVVKYQVSGFIYCHEFDFFWVDIFCIMLS